jgi:hypothetical protein
MKATAATCTHNSRTAEQTCGICAAQWCGQCDPGPSALCHYCHGRGYSTAEVSPPSRKPRACQWCYAPAEWGAWTPRHGWIDLCQRHYDEISTAVRSEIIERAARGPAGHLLTETHHNR